MKRDIKLRWFSVFVFLMPVLFIAAVLLNPPKATMDNFRWTQDSEQTDWHVGLPEDVGFTSDKLIDLHQQVSRQKSKLVQSLLIARHGKLVYEQYYPVRSRNDGTPMPRYFPPAADTFHQMRSATKTITSTLIGNLIYQNKISSVEVPLFDYFADEEVLDRERKKQILLKHALDFNSGLEWAEWGVWPSDAMGMWLSPDPYAYIFAKKVVHEPGQQFVYQGAMSVLLGGVVEKVTGMNLRQYAEEALFNPLGITQYDWFAHEKTGDYLGSSGLYLRSRDLAKLGLLYLNQGEWNGQQIFSRQWAQDCFRPQGNFWPEKTIEYGHNWWFPKITVNDKQVKIAGMRGSGGQEMFILPEYDLVFVMTSGAYIGQDEDYPFELLVDFVLPALGIEEAQYQPQV